MQEKISAGSEHAPAVGPHADHGADHGADHRANNAEDRAAGHGPDPGADAGAGAATAGDAADASLLALACSVVDTEIEALEALKARIDDRFLRAAHSILDCRGRVVVLGMGKSGHIGSKIAATLASTGTPAFFVHPGEASHGDIGMVTAEDVVILISNSGETAELITLLPQLKRLGVPVICLTGNMQSTLAEAATEVLDVSVPREACPLGLAPTASTTATLAMGDALAVALTDRRGFSAEDFARSHPGGSLGRRLLLHVGDIQHTGSEVPRVSPETPVLMALLEMTSKGLGMTAVCDPDWRVLGVFTDGDLRRALDRGVDLQTTAVSALMTERFTGVSARMLAAEALRIMQEKRINALLVIRPDNTLEGVLNMHDMLRAGVV